MTVLTGQAIKEYTIVGIAKFGTADSRARRVDRAVHAARGAAHRGVHARSVQPDRRGRDAGHLAGGAPDTRSRPRPRPTTSKSSPASRADEGEPGRRRQVPQLLQPHPARLRGRRPVRVAASSSTTRSRSSSTQRTREMALLRAIGAATRQVTLSVLGEAVVVGVVASATRLRPRHPARGRPEGAARRDRFRHPGQPHRDPDLGGGRFASSSARSVTVVSAIVPARKASRVPPIAAMRDVAIERRKGFGPRTAIGLVVTLGGGALMLWALFGLPDNALGILGLGAIAGLHRHLRHRPGARATDQPVHRRAAAQAAGHDGHARPRERDPKPAPHRRDRVGAHDRRRARRFHHDLRGVGQGVDLEHPRRADAHRLHRDERQRDRLRAAPAGRRRGDGRAPRARRGLRRSLREHGARRLGGVRRPRSIRRWPTSSSTSVPSKAPSRT